MHLCQCFFLFLFLSAFAYRHSTSSPICYLRHACILRFRTSCQEFCHLSSYSPSYLIIACSRSSRSRNHFLLIFLLLSGDIELNPGPVNFTLCSFNIRSILHPFYSAALSNLIDVYHPDLFCLTETWVKPTTTVTELAHCTPVARFPSEHLSDRGS